MKKHEKMTPFEKGIYNEAQSLYLQAKARKEEAYRLMEERLEPIRKAEELKRKKQADRLQFIENEKAKFANEVKLSLKGFGHEVQTMGAKFESGLAAFSTGPAYRVKLFSLSRDVKFPDEFKYAVLTAYVYVTSKGFGVDVFSATR